MFNSVVLDVVTSLIFIYLLYSLLVTALGEIVSTWLSMRAKVLRTAIGRMLTDSIHNKSPIVTKAWSSIKTPFKSADNMQDSFAEKFYNYPSIKYLTMFETVKLKVVGSSLPSYLSAHCFASTIFNLLKDKGAGKSHADKVTHCLKYNTCHIQPETLKQINNLYSEAGGDAELFKRKLEAWFEETMDRASGWYKRRIQLVLFIIGFGVAFAFNVDTIAIVKKLSLDKEASEKRLTIITKSIDKTTAVLGREKKESNNENQLSEKNEVLKDDASDINMVMGLGWSGVPSTEMDFFSYKIKLPLRLLYPLEKSFWGLVLTAIALSIGALLWFDLLKKLFSIRGTGVKPGENNSILTIPDESTFSEIGIAKVQGFQNSDKAATQDVLVGEARKKLESVVGVWSVDGGFIKKGSEKIPAIEVNIRDISVQLNAEIRLGKEYKLLPVNYLINNEPVTNDLAGAAEVGNATRANGFGTIGCILQKKSSSDTYILSCWHVLKGDHLWREYSGMNDIIENGKDNAIGKLVDGALTDSFDVGIVRLSSYESKSGLNKSLNIKRAWRQVTIADSLNETEVSFRGKNGNRQSAVIYNHSIDKSIFYADGKNYLIHDLIALVRYKQDGTMTAPSEKGDSGAVIVDKDGYPLGMIVASDSKFSYAVKLSNFLGENGPYNEYSVII